MKRKAGGYYRWREGLGPGYTNHQAENRPIYWAEQGSHRDKAWALGSPMWDSQRWRRGCFHGYSVMERAKLLVVKDVWLSARTLWHSGLHLDILCVLRSLELESVFHKI